MTVVEFGDDGEELAEYPPFIEVCRGVRKKANGRSIFGYWLGFWMREHLGPCAYVSYIRYWMELEVHF